MSTNKSFSTETSERYSRALFEVSNENEDLDKTENNIKNFQSLLLSSPEINNFMKNKNNISFDSARNIIKTNYSLEAISQQFKELYYELTE